MPINPVRVGICISSLLFGFIARGGIEAVWYHQRQDIGASILGCMVSGLVAAVLLCTED